mmetsp:Transcript_125/g.166  ORF Transcript_125/g.166 Transcript_125/m.166 type:complete len:412 (+) Transcript_125:88-1323(+)
MSCDYPVRIPYQIDLSVETTGKHLPITKRQIRCKFGFAYIPALLDGRTGVDCRGVEFELHLKWSLASGKHFLYFNDDLVYESVAAHRTQKFEHSFEVSEHIFPGGHMVHVVAWLTASSSSPYFRLYFNGQEYEQFLKMFELGSKKMFEAYGNALEAALSNGRVALHPLDEHISTDYFYYRDNDRLDTITNNNGISQGQLGTFATRRPRYRPTLKKENVRNKLFQSVSRFHHNHHSASYNNTGVDLNKSRTIPQEDDMLSTGMSLTSDPKTDLWPNPKTIQPTQPTNFLDQVDNDHQEAEEDLIDLGSNTVDSSISNLTSSLNSTMQQSSTSSSITLDTCFENSSTYSHLDPQQVWKTQNNVSFRLQTQPPVYSDNIAADLASQQGKSFQVPNKAISSKWATSMSTLEKKGT